MPLRTRNGTGARRRGGASLFVLCCLPAMLLAFGLAVYSAELVAVRTELQKAADATALAAAQTLVDDRTLLDSPSLRRILFAEAAGEADRFHRANPVHGQTAELDLNPDNDPDGDVVFGRLGAPRGDRFAAADLAANDSPLSAVNAVRVRLDRTRRRKAAVRLPGLPLVGRLAVDMRAVSCAMLDRNVLGFRPVLRKPIPLVPIALLSDPSGRARGSWEYQVERRGGTDQLAFDREACAFRGEADGLPEMRVRLGPVAPGEVEPPNAALLHLGVGDLGGLARQVRLGVGREHLEDFGGELVLGPDNRKPVPGTTQGPAPGTRGYALLQQALAELCRSGEPRAWPLFVGTDGDSGMPVLSGFVAGRVGCVVEAGEGGGLTFLVQPAVMSTVTAVTERAAPAGAPGAPNAYLCRVRLVE